MSSPTSAPAAPAPAGGIPFVTDAVRLLRVLISPGAVFTEIQDRPTYWGPFAVIAVVKAVLSDLQRPFQLRIGQMMAERAGRPAPPPGTVGTVISVIFSALGPLILTLIVGGVLYVLVLMFGGQTSYKKMMTVSIFTWPLTLIQLAVTWVVLNNRGVAAITGPQDLFVSLGADLLLPADTQVGVFPRLLLAGISPIGIWKLAITAVGLTVLGKTSKGGAWTAAIIIFVLAILTAAGLGAFSVKMMGG